MEKAKNIATIVFHSIWLAAAVLFYCMGIYMFNIMSGFSAWMLWGAFCVPVIVPFIFRMGKSSSRDGAKVGASTFTASSAGNTITVSNHPFMGAVFGFVAGVFLGIALGPVAVPVFALKAIASIVKTAIALKRGAAN